MDERQQIIDQGGDIMSITKLDDIIAAMATSFNQDLYLKIINKFGRFKENGLQKVFIHKVLCNGYAEVNWGNKLVPNDIKVEILFENDNNSKEKFIALSKRLFKHMNSLMKSNESNEDVIEKNAAVQTINHIFINFARLTTITMNDATLIAEIIKPFKYFTIENHEDSKTSGANDKLQGQTHVGSNENLREVFGEARD